MRVEATSTSAARELPAQGLADTQDFMTLLVAQLQAQDPLAPMDASQFVAQLAQLQSVAQLGAINTQLGRLASTEALGRAVALIGRSVGWQDAQAGELAFSTVERVELGPDGARLIVDGNALSLDEVVTVR